MYSHNAYALFVLILAPISSRTSEAAAFIWQNIQVDIYRESCDLQ